MDLGVAGSSPVSHPSKKAPRFAASLGTSGAFSSHLPKFHISIGESGTFVGSKADRLPRKEVAVSAHVLAIRLMIEGLPVSESIPLPVGEPK